MYFLSKIYSQDIDECKTGKYTCKGQHEKCRNYRGGYECVCKSAGYHKVNGVCVGKFLAKKNQFILIKIDILKL